MSSKSLAAPPCLYKSPEADGQLFPQLYFKNRLKSFGVAGGQQESPAAALIMQRVCAGLGELPLVIQLGWGWKREISLQGLLHAEIWDVLPKTDPSPPSSMEQGHPKAIGSIRSRAQSCGCSQWSIIRHPPWSKVGTKQRQHSIHLKIQSKTHSPWGNSLQQQQHGPASSLLASSCTG